MRTEKSRPGEKAASPQSVTATKSNSTASTDNLIGLTPEQSQHWHNWLADAHGLPAARLAFVAVVEVADGKYRRRPYLTLAGAQGAIDRAEARGVAARVILCELVPLGGQP